MTTILVVDDSPLLLSAMRDTLEAGGLEVVTTENPLEVPRLMYRRPPSLVLVDLDMPTLRGDLVTRIIRRAFGDAVVVLLHTGASPTASNALARECGADGVVQKMNDEALLLDVVKSWLARRAA